MNARLCDSLLCATCSLVRSPAMIAQSSLQSNWNASPGANASGTKVPQPLVWASRCRSAFPGSHERGDAVVGTVIAECYQIGVHLLGRAPLLARPADLDP